MESKFNTDQCSNLTTIQFIKENGQERERILNVMEKESKFGKMGAFMKVNGETIRLMVKAD